MLKTGMIIAERYEILQKIGTGGMADVYKAKDHKLNRFVAVKILKAEFREDTTFIRKFKSEAQAAAGLTHPNIVNVFDVGDDDGVHYIVMELIEGITLKEYISKKGKLSVKEATSIAIQVSMGLETAHSHGIVHRDVKPQNIIISTDGKVKVTDFGIARAASSNTISSNVMGSVHYSSPEQVRGGYSDEKSDIYSLGITLYEMVTGRVPFEGDTTVAIAIKHLQEEMVPPSAYTPELPYSLEQIIHKCTQKSVDRRYSNMEAVIADLKHSLIDPQGDFVKLNNLDTDAKTVVISDKELGEIKQQPKLAAKKEALELVQELSQEDFEEDPQEKKSRRKSSEGSEKKKKKKRRAVSRLVTIGALLVGAAILIGVIIVVARTAGLIGGTPQVEQQQTQKPAEDDGYVVVPDLVGRTEAEARELTNEAHIGIQMMGEEASTQEKGRISSQDIPAGTRVEAYSTLKYYISKGIQEIAVPNTSGYTGVEAQQILENAGFVVETRKEYSYSDEDGYPVIEPGYVSNTTPEAGSMAKAGDVVTLVISRGLDLGDSVEVPSVVGMSKNDALTILGKFVDIDIVEEVSTAVEVGEVISQNPEAYSYADPDHPITLTICSSGQPEAAQPETAAQPEAAPQTAAEAQPTPQTVVTGPTDGTWKCTQSLDTPNGYQGGKIRMELLQEVNGQPVASIIVEDQALTFPYKLDIVGQQGVPVGTLYVSEEINGAYHELGLYPLTFERVED